MATIDEHEVLDGVKHDGVVDLNERMRKEEETLFLVSTLVFLIASGCLCVVATDLGSLIDINSALFGVFQVFVYPGMCWICLMKVRYNFCGVNDQEAANVVEVNNDAQNGSRIGSVASNRSNRRRVDDESGGPPAVNVRWFSFNSVLWPKSYGVGIAMILFGCFITVFSLVKELA
jgi:hypothetical protein